ncbi:MAG: hypothetical protein IPH13_03485 [Planctomycetes bacterium]|nr:hypothetical protein [Planctomycetota bacterium]MCC7171673.1 hypothetical protein [Planctomycetota bacterium]
MRRFVRLVWAEWRTARATVIAGIVFAALFVAACDLAFTKGDPRYLGDSAMPAMFTLATCVLAADLLSRGRAQSAPSRDALLPVSAGFVLAARLAFLAGAAVLVGFGILASSWCWFAWCRSYSVPFAVWRAPTVVPLHWAAAVPATASVLLASACGARGMIALLAGLGSAAGIALGVHEIRPSDFGFSVGSTDVAWIGAGAACVLGSIAGGVFVRGFHRAVSAARRGAWATIALLAVLAPAGVVLATTIDARLSCEPGSVRHLVVLSLSPDQRHLFVAAHADSPLFVRQWIVDVHDGATRELPNYCPASTLDPEWLQAGLVRSPFATLVWNGLKLESKIGTFDVASGALVSVDGPFDPETCALRGFRRLADRIPETLEGFDRSFVANSLSIGDRVGACAVRTSPRRAEFYRLAESPDPHAVIDDLGQDDRISLLSQSLVALIRSADCARFVSFDDATEIARLPLSAREGVWLPGSGSSDAYVWRYRSTGRVSEWSLFHFGTGTERRIDFGAPWRVSELRVLDDGTVIGVVEPGILRRYQPDGTIVDTPLRLIDD